MAEEKREGTEDGSFVAIEWRIPDGIPTPFATNIIIQTLENEFKISFFEIKPPIRLDQSAPPPSKVNADCIASVIVTPDRLTKFLEVMQRQLEKFKSKKQKETSQS